MITRRTKCRSCKRKSEMEVIERGRSIKNQDFLTLQCPWCETNNYLFIKNEVNNVVDKSKRQERDLYN
jgi:phage FluMu protein Com